MNKERWVGLCVVVYILSLIWTIDVCTRLTMKVGVLRGELKDFKENVSLYTEQQARINEFLNAELKKVK